MAKVLVLPDHVASQIAAGEVVERPASVVKELVENSVDAGATQVEVAISADCRDIRVADNGCGMESEDAVLAFHRHATSKLKSADDLWTLNTLGFRGEALPSISSIAKVTCLTRTHQSETGSRIEARDGKVTAVETGCAPGTVMEVHELFYNVPARLSFLKRASTEFGHIHEIVQSLAIAYPHVAFHLLHAGNTSLKTKGTGDLFLAVVEAGLFTGKEALLEVNYADARNSVRVHGYVARPLHFRGDRKGIMSFVNKRPVRCPLTYKALDYVYSDLIPRGRYPLAVITVEVDPEQVDVNIHPTKKEIKYSNSNETYVSIQRAIAETLRRSRHEEMFAEEDEAALSSPAAKGAWQSQTAMQEGPSDESGSDISYGGMIPTVSLVVADRAGGRIVQASAAVPVDETAEQLQFNERLSYAPPAARLARLSPPSSPVGRLPECQSDEADSSPSGQGWQNQGAYRLPPQWRLVGYLHNTYILLETEEGLMIVEQHIAHERTLYERILSQQNVAGRICQDAQRLIISVPLSLTRDQESVLKQHLHLLQRFGFDFEMGKETVECVQVPLELAHKDYATVVQELVAQLAIADGAELELEATKSIACQSAIKNGMPLSPDDIIQLLCQWHETPRNDTCPHGRPVCIKFSMDKLFQIFHPA
jgi:DNA mismatch repair protein MutL